MKKFALKRRVLIVGEGLETEYNYFVGFRKAFEEELEATATSVSVARGKGGNASNIVESAIKEQKKFKPDPKCGDRVFLLLDTEGEGRKPELPAAEKLAKRKGIEVVYSCPAFEYWLLCHFPKASRRYFKDCDAVIAELEKKWKKVCKNEYDKADPDIFDRLADQLPTARTQALDIDLHHMKTVDTAIRTNPSTQVYELIGNLIGVQTSDKCPIQGTWQLIDNAEVTAQLEKGDQIPEHEEDNAHWKLQ
ncbi:MAG: RloB family protein [Gemmataceae bacterium]